PLSGNGFILMGNEGNGISEELRNLVTRPLLIPPTDPSGHPESLNVAIATAVTLSQFRSRLTKSFTN
ncbi:MAG: RNA methyltransferase, partial [Muribaculaceae bacterium]|nr:RNA methyltransferase [Muribaculaceae bacterium]